MRHKIKFLIEIETNDIDQESYMKLQKPLFEKIVDNEIIPLSFEEVNKILALTEKKFYVTGIEFPNMTSDGNSFEIKETKIEIKA